jgi:hypothetical protein
MNTNANTAAFEDGMKHVAHEVFEKGRSLLIDVVLLWVSRQFLCRRSKETIVSCTVLTFEVRWPSTKSLLT